MKDILWLIQKTLSVLLKNKKGLLIIISLPIIGTLISFSIYGNVGQGTLNIGVINKENQPIANDTVKFLEGLNHVNVSKIKESEVEDKLTSKNLMVLLHYSLVFLKVFEKGNRVILRFHRLKAIK